MAVIRGRQLYQNPGPTNIPDRVLRAMDRATIDFMGKEFAAIAEECFEGLRWVFRTKHAVIAFPANGHGAWEAAVVNVLSPGDHVLVLESGHFSNSWKTMVESVGVKAELLASDWRRGVDPAAVEARLAADKGHSIKAVLLVHNETSTGVANKCAEIRRAIDRAKHPALYLVDVISSLGSYDFRMDEWGIDVVVGGSQKGLMLPPGMSFTAVGPKAMAATKTAKLPRNYWDWRPLLEGDKQVRFLGTAPVHFFFGLQESIRMLREEGLEAIYARHHRLAEATRRAVRAWTGNAGPEIFATDPAVQSDSITAVLVPEGQDAEKVRRAALDRYNVSLGGGLGPLGGRVFRIGHMGDLNEAMILGALAVVEMALAHAGIPHSKGGAQTAIEYLGAN
ncbi:MAG TPA: aminotransferase class V-fold PLP-dependent enzyme [Candidatus Cybelea sp.]|nr:aminotransferase class V-fold PLP-dependent enzyme [Candidatus Cybelea sp.]